MAVVKKWRIYIEANILADWLLVETMKKVQRSKLSEGVIASHRLVSFLLETQDDRIQAFTSYWAVFEALGVIKRASVLVWMVLDGMPVNLYSHVKDSERYEVQAGQLKKIQRLINWLVKGDKRHHNLRVLSETPDLEAGMSLILSKNLEAADSFHVGIALSYGCDYFVTRDTDLDKIKTILSKEKIEALTSREMVERLQSEGLFRFPRIQVELRSTSGTEAKPNSSGSS